MKKFANLSEVIDDVVLCPLAKELKISLSQLIAFGDTPIERLNFSKRTFNGLKRRKLTTIGQVLQVSGKYLNDTPNLGQKSIREIKSTLRSYVNSAASATSSLPLLQALKASPEQITKIADIPISRTLVSIRTYNCLMKKGIETVGMLLATSEEQLYNIRNFGDKSMDEVKLKLRNLLANPTSALPNFSETYLPSFGDVLGFSADDIHKVADLPIHQLTLSRRALSCLKKCSFITVAQLLCVAESALRQEYHLSDIVILEISACLTDLHRLFQEVTNPKQLCFTWPELKHEILQTKPDLFWNIPVFLSWWNASTEIIGSEKDALQKRQQLRDEATGREYTLDGVFDACEQVCKEREWTIITARCGLNSSEKIETLHEISKIMEVSRERIRQQETQALNRIKDADGIISAFHETLVWMFERNEGILNIEHVAEDLQKYFSPGDVSVANLCLLFCKTFPEFTTVARAAAQKVKDAALSTEGPIYALKDKADGFTIVLETARQIWSERESTIKNDEWLGQVVDALNKNCSHLDSKYVLACLRADGRFDPSRFGTVQKLPTLKLALVETLQRMGAPAHFKDICAKLNQRELLNRHTNERYTHSCLGQNPQLFVCIDKGTYGLVSWGLEDQRVTRDRSILIADIIEQFLTERDEPVPQKEIIDYVMQRKKCSYISAAQRLPNDSRFRRTAPGVYGLSKWYFGDAVNIKLPTVTSIIIDVLKQIGKPASVADICSQVNEGRAIDQAIARSSINSCLNSRRELFVRVGMGIYGLASWGLEDQRATRERSTNIADIIETFLETHNEPATVKEIAEYVMEQAECKIATVNGALSRDSRFRRTRLGIYGLEKWFF